MKKLMLGVVVCVVLMFGGAGCVEGFTTTPGEVQALAAQQNVLQQQLDIVQTAATQMAQELVNSKIVDREIVAKVVSLNKEADRIQEQITTVAAAIENVPLTGDSAQDWIALLQAANLSSAEFNPYVVTVGAGLTLLSAFLAMFAKQKSAQAAKAQAKYRAHKQGVEKTMKEVSVSKDPRVVAVEKELYNNIGDARAAIGIT